MGKNEYDRRSYRNTVSRFVGRIANYSKPAILVKLYIKLYSKFYNINLNEFKIPQTGYKTFNAFFTRLVKPDLRKIETGIVSPVDGLIYDHGIIDKDRRIYVKHKFFSVAELLKKQYNKLESFVVFYLSPAHYHRVHAPFDMEITDVCYIPGNLRSVRESIVLKTEELYCRNERIVLYGDSEYGKFTFIFIGAFVVGKIKLSFEDKAASNIKKAVYNHISYDTPQVIKKGQELGFFEMGSSVIILSENDNYKKLKFPVGSELKLGVNFI
ncbi:MAG: archaetidylserine decarboxylase [Bacteroidales bacterium]|nr:archaetidylserine decarboxylase [Bacteroidales bacterium]